MTNFLYQPKDANGPVFKAPWEATAFSLVIALHKSGTFTWLEWANYLTVKIESAQAQGDADIGILTTSIGFPRLRLSRRRKSLQTSAS